jgi:hypothetical protein
MRESWICDARAGGARRRGTKEEHEGDAHACLQGNVMHVQVMYML